MRRWEDNNIRMDLKEIDVNTRNWVNSAQDGDYWKAIQNATLKIPNSISYSIELIYPSY